MKRVQILYLIIYTMTAFSTINAEDCPTTASTSTDSSAYVPAIETCNLFYDFTGKHGAGVDNIASAAGGIAAKSTDVTDGPLVILGADSIHIFDVAGKLITKVDTRTSPGTGFYEVTAISHIGPAIAYLAYIKEKDPTYDWKTKASNLLKDIRKVRKLNAVDLVTSSASIDSNSHWLDRLDNQAWNPFKSEIKNMFDYALSMSGSFLYKALQNEDYFTSDNVSKALLELSANENNSTWKVPFNNVMIATFHLEGLSEFYRLHLNLKDQKVDWSKARIIVNMPIGNNYGGGLWEGSNWVVSALKILAGDGVIDPNRLIIAAYAPSSYFEFADGLTQLSDTQLFNLSTLVFGSLYAQTYITKQVFTQEPLARISRVAMPGDYSYTKVSDKNHINHFVQRLQYSFGTKTELLSNTIGFWMPNEIANKKYVVSDVDVPGLNTGFPSGISSYPSNNPAIPQ